MSDIPYNLEVIQKSKLFQKFVENENAPPPPKPKILSRNQTVPEQLEQSKVNFNPSFEPSIPDHADRKMRTPERVDESSIYRDFAQLRASPVRNSSRSEMERIDAKFELPKYDGQKYDIPKYEPPKYDIPKYEPPRYDPPKYEPPRYEAPPYQDAPRYDVAPPIYDAPPTNDRLNSMISELRNKALEESRKYQVEIFNLNDQIATFQEQIYQLKKSEEYLQLENERLKNRIQQENLMRTKIDEDQKDLSLKNFELNDKLANTEAQVQRQREELIHVRTLCDQFKSDNVMFKQQLTMSQERNSYLESQLRTEIQRKEMVQAQLLEMQERFHRMQIDTESMRSEIVEYRRLNQESHLEVEALRKQIQEQRQSSLEQGRQQGYFQQQLFQANQQIEYLKTQLLQAEQQILSSGSQLQTMKPVAAPLQVNEYYPTTNMNTFPREEQRRIDPDQSFDKYQKYQQAMSKPTQAQQGGQAQQNYFKEKDMMQEQNERDIKSVESQLLNTQMLRQSAASELKKLEDSKIRTGANIRKKQQLEQQIQQNDQQIVTLRNRLREMNALFN